MEKRIKFGFLSLVYAFLYLPIIVLIINSFNASKFGIKWGGFTTKWYHALVNNGPKTPKPQLSSCVIRIKQKNIWQKKLS